MASKEEVVTAARTALSQSDQFIGGLAKLQGELLDTGASARRGGFRAFAGRSEDHSARLGRLQAEVKSQQRAIESARQATDELDNVPEGDPIATALLKVSTELGKVQSKLQVSSGGLDDIDTKIRKTLGHSAAAQRYSKAYGPTVDAGQQAVGALTYALEQVTALHAEIMS